jgi:hypothetical protein
MHTDDPAEFKDAREELSEEDIEGPASPVITTLPTSDANALDTEHNPFSPSSTMYNSHLSAPRHDGSPSPSPSSTSINERIVDTPSSENLREQAVGA